MSHSLIQSSRLEVVKIKAEIAKLQSEAEENLAEAALDQAKARESGSTADQKDLDFVEQESGVTQERDKEKISEQSRGNIQLKAVEQGLKNQGERIKQQGKNSNG